MPMFLKRIMILSFILAVMISAGTRLVAAQDVVEEGLKPLPELKSMNAEAFVKETDVINKAFEEDDFLRLEYQIHKDWDETEFINLKNIVRNRRLYGTVAEHTGPILGDIQPYFRVTVHEIDREISTRNWLINYVLVNGYTLRGLDSAEESFEAFYVTQQNIDSYAVRAVGRKFGPRMVVAEYAVPGQHWQDYRDYQTLVIKSVEFGGRDPETIEDRKFFTYLEAVDFAYPASWSARDEVVYAPNKLRIPVYNTIDGIAVQGEINVHVLSVRSVKDMDDFRVYDIDLKESVNDIRNSFTDNYIVHEMIEKKTYDMPETVKFQATDIYLLQPIETQYETHEIIEKTHELWFSVFLKGHNYYIVTMLTPRRSRELYNWAVNAEAYKVIVESLLRDKMSDIDNL